MLIGPPNAGKSAMLAHLTNARPEIAAYPFTTRVPQPGIMMWQDVPVQLVDLPPIAAEFFEPWVSSVIRSADAALLVADLSSDDVADATLERAGSAGGSPHRACRRASLSMCEDETIRHLKTVHGRQQARRRRGARPAGGRSRNGSRPGFRSRRFRPRPARDWNRYASATYHLLGVMRVYTKVPGKPVDRSRPFTLPIGSTVAGPGQGDSSGLRATLKSARIWGTGVFDGQAVKRDHELHDGDVVELHVA